MVASRRSGLMRTSGTVTMCPSSIGSCTSPWESTSASAWRTASPTRNCRCDGPAADSRCCPRDINFDLRSGPRKMARCFLAPASRQCLLTNILRGLERALYSLHPIAFDNVALAHVLEVLECHAAFLASEYLARVVLEALELRQLAFVNHHVVADETHVGA